jgi:hypothetical protein
MNAAVDNRGKESNERVCPGCRGPIAPGANVLWDDGCIVHVECLLRFRIAKRIAGERTKRSAGSK